MVRCPGLAGLWLADFGVKTKLDGTTVNEWFPMIGAGRFVPLGTAPTLEATRGTNSTITKPSIRFGAGKGLELDALASLFSGTDKTFTVIALVYHDAGPSANECLWSACNSAQASKSYVRTIATSGLTYTLSKVSDTPGTVSVSGGLLYAQGDAWSIVTAVSGAAASSGALRVNGIQAAADSALLNAQALTTDRFVIGCDYRGGAQNSHLIGNIAALAVFSGDLTDAQRLAAESILADWAGLPKPGYVYISPTGNDSTNGGVRAKSARLSPASAAARLNSSSGGGLRFTGTTAQSPMRVTTSIGMNKANTNWFVEGDGSMQYLCGSLQLNKAAWTNVGGGIYSYVIAGGAPVDRIFLLDYAGLNAAAVAALTAQQRSLTGLLYDRQDPGGQTNPVTDPMEIFKTSGTQTAPEAGAWGISGSTLYVHLPYDQDPSGFVFEVPIIDSLSASLQGNIWLKDLSLSYFGNFGVLNNGSTGVQTNVICENVTVAYCVVGFGIASYGQGLTCIDCRAHAASNDGWNGHRAGTVGNCMVLSNCISTRAWDDGFSIHENNMGYSTRSLAADSGSGGVDNIGTSYWAMDNYTLSRVDSFAIKNAYRVSLGQPAVVAAGGQGLPGSEAGAISAAGSGGVGPTIRLYGKGTFVGVNGYLVQRDASNNAHVYDPDGTEITGAHSYLAGLTGALGVYNTI